MAGEVPRVWGPSALLGPFWAVEDRVVNIRSWPAATVALVVVVVFALAGCGGSSAAGPGTSPTPSPTSPSGCSDVTALQDSLAALTQVKPLQDGVPALQAAIANVQTALDAALASASAALQPQVAQVKMTFDGLQTAVEGLSADTLTQQAPSIVAALTQLGTAASGLAAALPQNCPGTS